uniref:Uncharacterized protein n=1 Tax=Rhizophora mucronata TaxID=61149 RepID=A0A2P2J0R6_RHIMU
MVSPCLVIQYLLSLFLESLEVNKLRLLRAR